MGESHLHSGDPLALQWATLPSGTAPLLAALGRLRASGVAIQPRCRELAVHGCTLPRFQCARGGPHPAKPQQGRLNLLRSLGMRKNGTNKLLPGHRVSWSSSTLRWRTWCTWGTTTCVPSTVSGVPHSQGSRPQRCIQPGYPLCHHLGQGLPPLTCPELLLSTLQLQDPLLMGRDGVPIGEVPGGCCSVCCLLEVVMVGRQTRSLPLLSSPHSIIQSS